MDFDQYQLVVRDGKGSKDRITMLPDRLVEPLKAHLDKVAALHKKDLSEGFGAVYLPFALEKKYPNANREWGWQYVFPATHRSIDPRSGIERRHHIDLTVLQRAVKEAVRSAGLVKPASCHTLGQRLRHQDGAGASRPQGRVETTMIYTHVLNRGGRGVRSPLNGVGV